MTKRRQTLFLVELEDGLIGIEAYHNINLAKKAEREEHGNKLRLVRHATQQDVDWVRLMGGRIPEGVIRRGVV